MKPGDVVKKSFALLMLAMALSSVMVRGQAVPGKDENIPFLVTFGKFGETSWGDDDFNSLFFFTIPKDFNRQFYIKVFDPDCGGQNDEIQGLFDSKTMFSVYGGKGVDPDRNVESRGLKNTDNFKQGNLLVNPHMTTVTMNLVPLIRPKVITTRNGEVISSR